MTDVTLAALPDNLTHFKTAMRKQECSSHTEKMILTTLNWQEFALKYSPPT